VRDGATHRLQHRHRTLESLCVATGHDCERAIARAFDSATHWRVEKPSATLAQSLRSGACRIGTDSGAVDHDGVWAQRRRDRIDDFEDIRICGDAHHDYIAERSDISCFGNRSAAGFLSERLSFGGSAIPDCAEQLVFVQVARHPQAHGAQADEADPQGHLHITSIDALADARAAVSSSSAR
jgi:hypothetical protein